MKRFFSLFLCLCLILSGCGTVSVETAATISEIETVPTETTMPILPTTVSDASTSSAEMLNDITISETVIFDNGDFKLTVKEIDFSDNYDIKVKFLAENNSDKNVSILGQNFSINGITLYCSFYIEVAAGKKANDSLKIDRDDLAYVGITDIATIQGQDCYIYDKDISKKITDFRFNLSTSIADGYQQEVDRSGQTVYAENGVVVKYRGIVPGTYSGEELEFYFENETDTNLGIYVDNVSVNGFMVYGSMVAHAYPNCVTYETLNFSTSDLEDNDIEVIEEVSLNLYGYDQDASKKVWTSEEFTVGRIASTDSNNSVSDLTPAAEPSDTVSELEETHPISELPTESVEIPATESTEKSETGSSSGTYILNTNTKKFHYSWCSSAKKTKASNKKSFSGTRTEAIAKGYEPCNNCKP